MAATTFVFTVRDNSTSPPGARMTGLTPAWVYLKKLSDNTNVTQPAIVEIAQGAYKFTYDPASSGEASGQIDAGGTLVNPADRYIDMVMSSDTNGNMALGVTGLDAIATTAPIGPAATFPAMLIQLWRRQFKKSTLTATQLKTYADDGATVISTQTVSDDGTTQTQGVAL